MYLASEYNTKPRIILVHSPESNLALRDLTTADETVNNFNAVPDWEKLQEQFRDMVGSIRTCGIEVIDLVELLDETDILLLGQNPNSMFTRDPLITLPWNSEVAILANMPLAGRHNEPRIMKKAVHKLGVEQFFEPPEAARLEGGDVLAVSQNGQRTLYVGLGRRTNKMAVEWLAETLIPRRIVDEIVCLEHDKKLLHLDTCFTMLPNQTIVCAQDVLTSGFVISADLKARPIDPMHYFRSQGFKTIFVSQISAARDEYCNMLNVGDNYYLSFNLPDELADAIEEVAHVGVREFDGSEISKANGGIHCLTRPLY